MVVKGLPHHCGRPGHAHPSARQPRRVRRWTSRVSARRLQ